MCDLHLNCATVSMLESANLSAPPEPAAGDVSASTLPPGFLALTEEEYSATIRQEALEQYYEVNPTPLSEGRWASVHRCRLRSTGAEYAAKFCHKLRLGLFAHQEILHEVSALRHCQRCPRIVQLREVFETEHQYILIMEFGRGGDLQSILDTNQVPYEHDVIRFMRSLLEGLVFIHERNIAHLDIKPQNVVLTAEFPDCDVKLCDLEISRVISSDHEIREMLGTPDYVAPEILRFDPVTLTADIWSVGVLAYVLLTGFTPFGGETDSETFRNISKAHLDFPDELFEDVSELAKDFIRRCVVRDARSRLTARQSLMHPWLQQTESSAARPPSVHGSNQSIISTAGEGFGSTDSVIPLRRSVSKSREVLSEKVSLSQVKKNISKSRERLCDLKFGLSKSRDRIPAGYRGVSRSSELLSNKPPWRAAGVNCPLGKPLPPPMERMGSFKVRDQYQSQVVAGLGSSQSLSSVSSPFVRHCSLRKRKKQQEQQQQQQQQQQSEVHQADFRSSLRRHKNSNNQNQRRNSLQMESRTPEDDKVRDQRRRSHSNREELDLHSLKQEKRRDVRRESSAPPNEAKNMIIVEIISDGEEEDVFTRLYKDRLKDSELKWRKLRDSDFDRNDDEKENKSSNKSNMSVNRFRREVSPSCESVNSRGDSKSGSDEALIDRLNTLTISADSVPIDEETYLPSETSDAIQDKQGTQIETRANFSHSKHDNQYPKRPAPVCESLQPRDQISRRDTKGGIRHTNRLGRRTSLTEGSRFGGDETGSTRMRQARGSMDASALTAKNTTPNLLEADGVSGLKANTENTSDRLQEPTISGPKNRVCLPGHWRRHTSASPERSPHRSRTRRSSLVPETERRRTDSGSNMCFKTALLEIGRDSRPKSTVSEPCPATNDTTSWLKSETENQVECRDSKVMPKTKSSQTANTLKVNEAHITTTHSSAKTNLTASSSSNRSVNTEPIPTKERGINTDTVLLAAVVDEDSLWERTEVLSSDCLQDCDPVETPRLTVETVCSDVTQLCQQPLRCASPVQEEPGCSEQHRQTSMPPPAVPRTSTSPLSKSSTDDDVHRRVRGGTENEKRSVAFVDSGAVRNTPERNPSVSSVYHRSSSLSSDLGSSELSSETSSDSYCIVSWEEAPTSAARAVSSDGKHPVDQATELKPVVTTRGVGRPRSHSTQIAPMEMAQLRHRGRSNSLAAEQPFNAAQPWGPLCSGSVARAFQKFHSMSADQRQKRRQSSPNIATFASKVSDIGQV